MIFENNHPSSSKELVPQDLLCTTVKHLAGVKFTYPLVANGKVVVESDFR